MITKKEVSIYLKRVKQYCPYALRKRLSAELEGAISEYAEENPDKTIEDLINRFGAPQKYAEEYITEMPAAEKTRILRKGRTILTGIVVSILTITLIFIVSFFWIVHNNDNPHPVYYQKTYCQII
ncbi:MAG: hypothetical protein J6K88_04515 [Oscillospiraceae bacterium]|nr:hypothetical protein [Oscillospiraceae bacterium]